MKNINLLTERLTVRELTFADAAFILRLLNEPSFIENIADKGVRNRNQKELILAASLSLAVLPVLGGW